MTNVQSEDGYGFPAIQLFVIVIKYLKDKILKQLEGTSLVSNIHFTWSYMNYNKIKSQLLKICHFNSYLPEIYPTTMLHSLDKQRETLSTKSWDLNFQFVKSLNRWIFFLVKKYK